MTLRRWSPPSEQPRLRRAITQELARGPAFPDQIHRRVSARDVRPVAFIRAYRELLALERDGLVRSRYARRHRDPLRRACRLFSLVRSATAPGGS